VFVVKKRSAVSLMLLLFLGFGWGCGGGGNGDETVGEDTMTAEGPATSAILATNAFYYYADVQGAWDFYTRVLGFRTVADYGFAKILQVAPTSYLTLVDEAEGMHNSSEPKSVTLAIVTEEVEAWWAYLSEMDVPMRSPLGEVGTGRPHDGFVAVDPEGYLLEFERFNPHPENEELIPALAGTGALYSPAGTEMAPGVTSTRPPELGVQATVLWLYYQDLEAIEAFYRETFGRDIIVDQGWAKVFPTSPTGYIGFVDGERGLHSATEEKAVTVSFFTEDLGSWFTHTQGVPGFSLRTEEITSEGDFVHTFVGYDPEGYFLEWDTFLNVPSNEVLLGSMELSSH
jgi:catechol 2,3-dioxygenase-like lactoylglutathione lyase family enzyme